MRGHVTLCYMVVGGNLNSPLNLFISFAKALMEQGFPSDLFWRRTGHPPVVGRSARAKRQRPGRGEHRRFLHGGASVADDRDSGDP